MNKHRIWKYEKKISYSSSYVRHASRVMCPFGLQLHWKTLWFESTFKQWVNFMAAFAQDISIWNRNNLVRLGLALQLDRSSLELLLENSVGDICLVDEQKTIESRRSAPITFLFNFVHFLSGPIWNRSTRQPVRFQLGPNSKADPVETDQQSQIEPVHAVPWKCQAYLYRECQGSH